MNKAQQIRAYKEANPTHKPSDIAKACGVSTPYVYQALKNATKKPKAEKKLVTAGQETLRKEIVRLHNEIDQWKNLADLHERRVNAFMNEVRELKLHHSGLEYVISYLESRLGIGEKRGSSV
jgi:4-diphosphocytidyl-2C-methyl-D-erythritol kinase